MIVLRPVRPGDCNALLEIYRPYVETTSITFETEVPDEEEFLRRIVDISGTFPYLAAEEHGTILGYAYAHAFHERAAYGWTVESSVYVRRDVRGQGLGRKLYGALLPLLEAQGVRNVCAVITIPNDRSIAFHHAMGFTTAGLLPDFGYKLGQWHDVAYLYRRLGPGKNAPEPLIPMPQLSPSLVETLLRRAAEG